MARPKKQAVDYFPHSCVSGKTIFILEQDFGNDGYAFWFKMLEILGTKVGHVIDCNDIAEFKFLQAKTRVGEETATKILQLLADLDAIDKDLWGKKVIWSQNFVDGVSHVYQNRKVEKPSRPDNYCPKPHDAALSTDQKRHSIVEYSIVENSIGTEIPDVPPEKWEMIGLYRKSYEDLKKINGYTKKVSEEGFRRWKDFVALILKNNYTELFQTKFVSPQGFQELITKHGFTENLWDDVLKKILATGVKPEHNLFFRIPDYINYLNRDKHGVKKTPFKAGKDDPTTDKF